MIDLDLSKNISKKSQCKQLMNDIFGPASASRVDEIPDSECVQQCREKVRTILGDAQARQFDELEKDMESDR